MSKILNSKSEMDFEIQFYDGIIKRSPNFIEVLGVLGDLYTKRGLFTKGLKIDERLSVLRPNDPIVLYNLACSYSLLNKLDFAFMNIKKAIKYGYDDLNYMSMDEDLNNLRTDARFRRYFSRIRKKLFK